MEQMTTKIQQQVEWHKTKVMELVKAKVISQKYLGCCRQTGQIITCIPNNEAALSEAEKSYL
jgi:hypothetical protein